jgi:hypothetical protein
MRRLYDTTWILHRRSASIFSGTVRRFGNSGIEVICLVLTSFLTVVLIMWIFCS